MGLDEKKENNHKNVDIFKRHVYNIVENKKFFFAMPDESCDGSDRTVK